LSVYDLNFNFIKNNKLDISASYYDAKRKSLFLVSENKIFSYTDNTFNELKLSKTQDSSDNEFDLQKTVITSFVKINNLFVLGTQKGQMIFYINIGKNSYEYKEKIDVHFTEITKLFFDNYNKILYSSSYDNQLLKFNLFEKDSLDINNANNNSLSLEGHQKWVWDIDEYVDLEGKRRLLTSDENGNLISWFLNQKDLVERVSELHEKEKNKMN
jgi:WD40 repeat protein